MRFSQVRHAPMLRSITLALCATANICTAHPYTAQLDAKKYTEVAQAIARTLQTDPTNADALVASVDLMLLQANAANYDEAVTLAQRCIHKVTRNTPNAMKRLAMRWALKPNKAA